MFIIAAAIIRATITLSAHPSSIVVNSWSVRETIVGLLAINLPILRPLFSYAFWKRGQFPDVRRPHPPPAAGDDFGAPIRRGKRRPFGTLFSFNSLFTAITTNKTTSTTATTTVTKVTQVENNQDVEAAICSEVKQPKIENNDTVQPMAHISRENENKMQSNCERYQQGDSVDHGLDHIEFLPLEGNMLAPVGS